MVLHPLKLYLVSYLFVLIFFLVGVAFYTLLERKVLSYVHFRLGPNSVGFLGVFQPFSDALSLFSKGLDKFFKLNFYFYVLAPSLGLFLVLILMSLLPYWGYGTFFIFGFIYFFCVSSLMVYFLLGSGWSSMSKYSLVGAYRSASQVISYEVSMFFLLFGFCWVVNTYSMYDYCNFYTGFYVFLYSFPLFVGWLLICLAESNRSPFDFSEGESELVSGFNTEYFGGLFSLIFITEYSSILFLSVFSSFVFLGGGTFFWFKGFFFSFFYLWVRSSFPRLRYDKLMLMAWKSLLPFVLGVMVFLFLVGFSF